MSEYNYWLERVKTDSWALKYVFHEYKDYKLCLLAVSNGGCALYYTPHKLRDYKLCKTAIGNDGRALYYTPHKLRDYKLYLLAVSNFGGALNWVPQELRDYKLCLLAVGEPRRLRSERSSLRRHSNYSWALQDIPLHHKDSRILWIANRDNNYPQELAAANIIRSWVIKWLYRPSGLRTRKMMYSAYS